MAASALRAGVVAASEGGDLDPKHFIGRFSFYTLPDEERNGAKLVRAWHKNGLDIEDLPEARQPVHIFQSACASVRTRKGGTNGQRVEVRADEIENRPGICSYQITSAVWDLAAKVIEHEKGMRVEFDKRASTINFVPLDGYDARLEVLAKAIQSHFDANAKTVPGSKIRGAIRSTLLKIGAQNMRRKAGGLYFVPAEWTAPNSNGGSIEPTKPTLDGIAGVLEDLYGDRADFHTIPLVDSEGEREMVRKHFTINANEKAAELTVKALQRVRVGKGERGVRSDLLANLYNERRKLMGAVNQFEQLVALEQTDLEANLTDLDNALAELQDLADAPK